MDLKSVSLKLIRKLIILLIFLIIFLSQIKTTSSHDSYSNYDESFEDENDNAGIFGKLRNFVSEMGNTFKDVLSGIEKIHKGFKSVEEFLDHTFDEDCFFECPNGLFFTPNPKHIPKSNGCGSFGLEEYIKEDMLPMTEFVSCCNQHDICYESCGKDKDECDLKFKKCLYAECKREKENLSALKYKGCKAGAKILTLGTLALGCKPYIDAQRESCLCKSFNSKTKEEL